MLYLYKLIKGAKSHKKHKKASKGIKGHIKPQEGAKGHIKPQKGASKRQIDVGFRSIAESGMAIGQRK